MLTRAADRAANAPVPSLAEKGMLMSTYEEFMVILTAALLIMAILNYIKKDRK